MTHVEAKELMVRYFDGETTLEQEANLRDYFQQENIDASLEAYRLLFGYWREQSTIKAPGGVLRPLRRRRWWSISAAAAIAVFLVVATGLFLRPTPDAPSLAGAFPAVERQPVDWSRYEVTDEKEAMKIVVNALRATSDGVEKSTALTVRELRRASKLINQ